MGPFISHKLKSEPISQRIFCILKLVSDTLPYLRTVCSLMTDRPCRSKNALAAMLA